MKLLLEGRPGSGKTTVARRLLASLIADEVDVTGFTTAEIRENGTRVGFTIETVDGQTGVLAHIDFQGPRVGKYGVDVAAFEELAIPALEIGDDETIVVVDELGKMELLSDPFCESVQNLFEDENRIVATVHLFKHPFTERLKGRPDTELIEVTKANRDGLPEDLLARLIRRSRSE